jgi:CubicO group peptidase (beta-lactamase class C family)
MKRREFFGLGAVSAIAARTFALGQSADRFEDLANLVEAKMAQYHIPGVSFGLMKSGKTTVRSFGVTSVEDPQPVTPETVFPIASISKTFTTTAMMRLIDQGKVELKAPVRQYIPEFRVQDETASREVSIWNLLTHTPGWEGQVSAQDRGVDTMNFYALRMRDMPQLSAPGTVWSYNNAGFNLAGRVLEVVTGKGVHDALKDLVYTPLGLRRATSRTGEAMSYRFAKGHRQRPQSTETLVLHNFELPADTTAGGIATTIQDLMTYAAFHLGDGTAEGQPVVSRASLEIMKTPQIRKNSTGDESMGVGWHIRYLNGVLTCAQGGTLGGHTLLIQLGPSRNLAFAIQTNHQDGWRLIQDVERATLKSYEGLAVAPNQATGGNRGVSETMILHATPLAEQPDLAEYVGTYQRPPVGKVNVRIEGGKLVAGNGSSLIFYAPDMAYVTEGPGYVGTPYEFIRTPAGKVGWIRVNGRVARKDS